MAKTGRPEIKISVEDFEKLCSMQCTLVEIAGFFNCCEDTIENWVKKNYDGETFSEVYKKKSAKGKISIRRKQFQVADAGNTSMLIWLGKQYLGQTEKQEVSLTNTEDESVREMQEYFDKKKSEEEGDNE